MSGYRSSRRTSYNPSYLIPLHDEDLLEKVLHLIYRYIVTTVFIELSKDFSYRVVVWVLFHAHLLAYVVYEIANLFLLQRAIIVNINCFEHLIAHMVERLIVIQDYF